MTVINEKRDTIVTQTLFTPTSLLDQTIGLLRYKEPKAMLLQTRFGIHTIGMRYPIDILILNRKKQVVALKKNLKPNRIFLWNFNYNTVLELPPETINKTKTQLHDTLHFLEAEKKVIIHKKSCIIGMR